MDWQEAEKQVRDLFAATYGAHDPIPPAKPPQEQPTEPTFDDLMRVLFASEFFCDCQECAVWTEVQAAFPEQFARWARQAPGCEHRITPQL